MEKKNLAERFLEIKDKIYPPVNNVTTLAAGAGGFTKNFGNMYYSEEIKQRMIIIMKEGLRIGYLSESAFEKMSKNFFRDYWKDPSILADRFELFETFVKEINTIYDLVSYKFLSMEDYETLLQKLKSIVEASREMNCSAWFSTVFDKKFCQKLIKENNINIPKKRLDEIWKKASSPANYSFYKSRYRSILEVLKKYKEGKIASEKLQFIKADYGYVPTVREIKEYLSKRFLKLDNQQILQEIRELDTEIKDKMKVYTDWFIDLSDDEQKLVDYIQKIMWLRDARKDPISKALVVHYRIAEKMFNDAELDPRLIYYVTYEELLKGVEELKTNKERFIKRKNGVVFLYNYNGELSIEQRNISIINDTLKKKYLMQHNKIKKDFISGEVANPGKVTGRVKIILDPNNPGDFKEGDILVAGATRPDFIPLMKNAGAIITDEGGITSHASIVSREMNKPCITGTRIATIILKNDMEVEVDADKGVVRIL